MTEEKLKMLLLFQVELAGMLAKGEREGAIPGSDEEIVEELIRRIRTAHRSVVYSCVWIFTFLILWAWLSMGRQISATGEIQQSDLWLLILQMLGAGMTIGYSFGRRKAWRIIERCLRAMQESKK